MASVTLKLSTVQNKKTGKSEILLRYRSHREIALRAHTHVFILPKFFVDGEIVIKNRIITDEVREAQEAKATIDKIVSHITEQGDKKAVSDFTLDWAQDTIDRLLYPENYKYFYVNTVTGEKSGEMLAVAKFAATNGESD